MFGSAGDNDIIMAMGADISNYQSSLATAGKDLRGFTNLVEDQGKQAGGFLDQAFGVAAGGLIEKGVEKAGGALLGFLGDAIKESQEAAAGQAQLGAVLASTGGKAGVSAQMVNDLAGNLQNLTNFTDDQVLSAENMELTFTNIGKEVFPEATERALDMAQALGGDVKSQAMQLGKALNDPIQGMSALSRVGVTFTEQTKAQIKVLQQSGDLQGAQKIILAELATEFGGAAKAAGQTFGGQLAIASHRLDDMKQEVGDALMPALTELVGVGSNLTGMLFDLGKGLVSNTPLLLGLGTAIAAGVTPTIVAATSATWAWATTAIPALVAAWAPILLPLAAVGAAVAGLAALWQNDFGGMRTFITDDFAPAVERGLGRVGAGLDVVKSKSSEFFADVGRGWDALIMGQDAAVQKMVDAQAREVAATEAARDAHEGAVLAMVNVTQQAAYDTETANIQAAASWTTLQNHVQDELTDLIGDLQRTVPQAATTGSAIGDAYINTLAAHVGTGLPELDKYISEELKTMDIGKITALLGKDAADKYNINLQMGIARGLVETSKAMHQAAQMFDAEDHSQAVATQHQADSIEALAASMRAEALAAADNMGLIGGGDNKARTAAFAAEADAVAHGRDVAARAAREAAAARAAADKANRNTSARTPARAPSAPAARAPFAAPAAPPLAQTAQGLAGGGVRSGSGAGPGLSPLLTGSLADILGNLTNAQTDVRAALAGEGSDFRAFVGSLSTLLNSSTAEGRRVGDVLVGLLDNPAGGAPATATAPAFGPAMAPTAPITVNVFVRDDFGGLRKLDRDLAYATESTRL